MGESWNQSVRMLGQFRSRMSARSAVWSAREFRLGPVAGATACALLVGVAGCGSGDANSTVTCDEYAQKELAPPNIGGESQSTDIIDMLRERELPVSIDMTRKLESAVSKFCGKPSPRGGDSAKRNNSRPISDGVDWDAISG